MHDRTPAASQLVEHWQAAIIVDRAATSLNRLHASAGNPQLAAAAGALRSLRNDLLDAAPHADPTPTR